MKEKVSNQMKEKVSNQMKEKVSNQIDSKDNKYRKLKTGKEAQKQELKKQRSLQTPYYIDELIDRERTLNEYRKEAEIELQHAPKGTLQAVTRRNGNPEYYCRQNPSESLGTYLHKSDMKQISALAQKYYDEKFIRAAEEEQKRIQRMLSFYENENRYPLAEEAFHRMNEACKKLVKPYLLSGQEWAEEWLKEPYYPKKFSEKDETQYYTAKRERVRSKSEIWICDELNRMGITYRYEKQLVLENSILIHPDITALNQRKRKVLFWEHLGRMDDEDYCEDALLRISMYERNGIYPGKQLILTHETKKHQLDIELVRRIIREYLL